MWKQRFATSVAGVGVLLAALVLAPVASARPAAAAPTDAALPSSVGTHFWLAFPANIGSQTLKLHITAETSTSATVKFGSTTIPATVQAGITEVVLIPSLMVVDELDNITAQGIEVMALDPVSVYALNTADDSTGGFLALPVTALGLDYRVLAAPATEDNQLTVVATADDTVVTVTPEVGTGPHPAGVSFSRGMDAGETYQWRASGPGDSISGTTVSANKQIVVYGGATCGYVPSDSTPDCSHMVQQMTPTNTWGTQFLTMPFAGRSPHSFYRILADEDGTELHVNGGAAFALAAGGVFDLEINSETVEIASSKPVLVAQFAYGYGAHVELLGDPLMLLLAPADRYLSRYTVPAPERVGYQAYATLIMAAADVGQITMDGVLVSTANIERIGDSGYWGLTLSFSAETHRFDGPNGFGLQVYEWGDGDGFGFTGGMAMVPGPVADMLFASGSGPWAATVDTVPVDGSVALLLNGTTPANPVTVTGQGYYSLEPNTQTIVFSPLAGYVGTPDPVTYQVTDAYGRNATNTFHPEVADRAPGTPGTPTAVAGDGQATVTFVAPDDGGTIVSYTIRVVGVPMARSVRMCS